MLQNQIYRQIVRRARLMCISKCAFSSQGDETESTESKIRRRRFLRQSQGLHAFRPEENINDPTIVLFPGQGSQFVGMAKSLADIPEARDMFEIASDMLR